MKIKSGYVLHSMGKEYVVVAVEERTKEFCGMIRLNATGAFLWEQMEKECTEDSLVQALMEKYDVTKELAEEGVASFLAQISKADVVEQ